MTKPRTAHLVRIIVHAEVEEVGEIVEQPDDLALLLGFGRPVRATGARRQTNRDRTRVTDRFLGLLEELTNDPNAVLERSTVLVDPRVVRRQELRQQIVVGRIHVGRCRSPPAARAGLHRHASGEDRASRVCPSRDSGRARAPAAGRERGPMLGSWVERFGLLLPPCQSSTPARDPCRWTFVHHQRVRADVFVIPQRGGRQRLLVGAGVDRTVLGADDPPTTLGLRLPHRREALRQAIPQPSAVRNLVEPVRSHDRTDLHRLEQDRVAVVALGSAELAHATTLGYPRRVRHC